MGSLFRYTAGNRFNHWTLVAYAGDGKWTAECDCGTIKDVYTCHIAKGKSKSCGSPTCTVQTRGTHRQTQSSEYRSWNSAKQRCINPNNDRYKDYGGAGVRMCDRWLNSFENFLADMGERPKGCSIDRIDTFGNYEPSNCRWATAKEQQNNLKSQALKGYSISEEAEKSGLTYAMVQTRLKRGWTLEDATSIPNIKGQKVVKCKVTSDFQLSTLNTSGVRGVHQNKRSGKWVAQITVLGKVTTVGTFKTIEEAEVAVRRARDEAEKLKEQTRLDKKENLKQQRLNSKT